MNVGFWEKHQDTSYEEARALLENSHKAVIDMMEGYGEEDLFTKGHFSWTGSNNFASYCISTTSSHYDWAIKKIKAQIKALKM